MVHSRIVQTSVRSNSIKTELRPVETFTDQDPFRHLGHHIVGGMREFRCFLPLASKAWIENERSVRLLDLERLSDTGLFTGSLDQKAEVGVYFIVYEDPTGYVDRRADPYQFQPSISDFDIYLFKKGELHLSYETLGAHISVREGVSGTRFVVWAPNASAVSVVGNFNHWKPGSHPMANVKHSGLWELFIPGIGVDEIYKFAIRSDSDGNVRVRTDPYAFRTELRPRTGSIVTDLSYDWTDAAWIAERSKGNRLSEPISVYEVHFGSWHRPDRGFPDFRKGGLELINYARRLGFTHIELLPVMEHPLDASWGYQVINYYAPTSRYGTPADFKWFINECHRNGLGVILDWVPAHFPDDEFGLSMYDGTHLFDHEDPRKGRHPDWGTNVFNYGRNEVRNFLISNALFWTGVYHADGLRIDAVSSMLYLDYSRKEGEWVPNRYGGRENLDAIAFLRDLNSILHEMQPGIMTIAEESTAWGGVTGRTELGGLGFDFKWNMGWMHDTLEYFSKNPVHRKYHQRNLTFSVWYAFSERFMLPLSHDEVVHGKGSLLSKMPGDYWQKFANLRLCLAYQLGSPGKKLLFMGGEFGQWSEWDVNRELDWQLTGLEPHSRLSLLVGDMNRLYREYSQLHSLDSDPGGFEWIDFGDTDNSIISFIRHSNDGGKGLIFVYNMTPVPRHKYRIGVPWRGKYLELLNTDAADYGGSGMGNFGGIASEDIQMHGRPQSVSLTLPPLAAEIFLYEGDD